MKRKDFEDLRTKSAQEIGKILVAKRLEANKKRMEALAGKEKNLKLYRNLRREIAKILTLVREKEIIEKITKVEKPEDVKGRKEKA